MFDTLTVDDDAPLADEICNQNWQLNQESVGATLRVNSDSKLEILTYKLKHDVELTSNQTPTEEQVQQVWQMIDDFNNPLYLNGKNHNAVLMIWDGVVKDVKIEEVNYDKIQSDI